MTIRSDTLKSLLACAVLTAGTIVAFWNVKDAGFVNYDDPTYITDNVIVQRGLTLENIKWAFTTLHFQNWHPLTWLSYMTDIELFGVNAAALHLVNLAFHLANTLLIFLVLRRLTGAMWASGIVAAFFGWHPLHVESVVWISERKDVLSTLFWLLTMWAYAEYARRQSSRWYAGMLVFFTLGLMSKAMLVTLPFVLLLIDVWPLRRLDLTMPQWWRSSGKRLVVEKLPLFALAAAVSCVTYIAQSEAVMAVTDLPIGHRAANAVMSYDRYIGTTLWPTDLAVFYPHSPLPGWQVIGAAIVLLLISLAAVAAVRSRPYVFMGWFWFLGTLVPVIGLVQAGNQAMADRYMYVPSIGLFVAIVWSLYEEARSARWPKLIAAGLTTAALVACLMLSARQVQYWKDSVTLWLHAERVTPPNIIVLNNLREALVQAGKTNEARQRVMRSIEVAPGQEVTWLNAGQMAFDEGRFEEALTYYRNGLQLKPHSADLNFCAGLVLDSQGKITEAVEHYRRAILTTSPSMLAQPASFLARMRLANVLVALGDWRGATSNYLAVIELRADFAPAHYQLGNMLLDSGHAERAVQYLRRTLQLAPDSAEAYRQLGLALSRAGNRSEALQHLRSALQLNPDDALAHAYLAGWLAEGGEIEKAIHEYREAIRLDPKLIPALNNLAWLLATQRDAAFRDARQAVELAERACELSQRRHSALLGTLAAAYAEAGQFSEAVAAAEKAIALAESGGEIEVAKKNRELLSVYRDGKPWREPVRDATAGTAGINR